MYYPMVSRNFDQEAFVDIPAEITAHLGKEETQIRVHEYGYVEGDTNGVVGNNERDWHWYSDENGWDFEVTDREALQLFPIDSKIRAVHLSGDKAKAALAAKSFKGSFSYDGELWRVYYLRGVWKESQYSNSKSAQIGEHDNWECFGILVSLGSETLEEVVYHKIRHTNLEWHDCDCQQDF